jgi:hypothetical protein
MRFLYDCEGYDRAMSDKSIDDIVDDDMCF